MKKILIPFDFTDVSLNAVKYAVQLFSSNVKFTVYHVISGNLTINEPLVIPEGLTRTDGLEEEMKIAIEKQIVGLETNISYDIEVVYGSTVDMIIKRLKDGEYDGIVMGKRDKYGLLDKIFGTIALGVIKKSSEPVYVVPENTTYKPYRKVVVAADHHLESDYVLEAIESWNATFNADLHFLHVSENEKDEGFVKNIVEEFFEKKNVKFPFTISEEYDDDVAEELIEYADDENADLQMIISDKSTWLNSITSKSVSREMILKAKRPMLFLHSGMKKYSSIFFNLVTV